MEFQRILDLSIIEQKSIFLFGPRQTGKSFLLKKRFPHAIHYNLLHSDVFLKLSKSPHLLRQEISVSNHSQPVIIDEIQRIPELLNEVHFLIEEYGTRFILTGSSARKLKQKGTNLLAGRALTRKLFPLVSREIGNVDLLRVINFGALPAIYNSSIPEEELEAYVGTYLQEEIKAEGIIRNLETFIKFLENAALYNTEQINFSNIANDIGVSPKTIKEYYSILEDTLIGILLPPYKKTVSRKSVSISKFFYFDLGVANMLSRRKQITIGSELFGKCFEHFIFTEIRAFLEYNKDKREFCFWRSTSKHEVDFIIGDDVAIEVKGTTQVQDKHLKGLEALCQEIDFKHKIVVSLDDRPRLMKNKYLVLPYQVFLQKLWDKEFN